MKISNWNNSEIKALFAAVENSTNRYTAFSEHAKKHNRKTNSVRNFYYATLKDSALCKKLNLAKHCVSKPDKFSKSETQKLVQDISDAVSKGKSVRSACLELSGNNPALMLRMQNKYRTITKTKPDNIIKLPKRERDLPLTDQDLANLFMGIIRLVKNNEEKTK